MTIDDDFFNKINSIWMNNINQRSGKTQSIRDIINDRYGIHNDRVTPHYSLFSKSRLRKDLQTHDKIIIFRFFYNLRNPIDIKPFEPLIF
ncbi:MAG: hypothetical protein UR43_C0019G0034 [candidate division TM6 bacterium GW2011_GWF2_33_332]|nr:MAG: hypothetical protein UR43_C0019G0034 [candidate division TM6 bacterium GW2011_GWF2_33_332]